MKVTGGRVKGSSHTKGERLNVGHEDGGLIQSKLCLKLFGAGGRRKCVSQSEGMSLGMTSEHQGGGCRDFKI